MEDIQATKNTSEVNHDNNDIENKVYIKSEAVSPITIIDIENTFLIKSEPISPLNIKAESSPDDCSENGDSNSRTKLKRKVNCVDKNKQNSEPRSLKNGKNKRNKKYIDELEESFTLKEDENTTELDQESVLFEEVLYSKQKRSAYKTLHSMLSSEGEKFMHNLKTLGNLFPQVRYPLLAGVLETRRSLEESLRTLNKAFAQDKKYNRKKYYHRKHGYNNKRT